MIRQEELLEDDGTLGAMLYPKGVRPVRDDHEPRHGHPRFYQILEEMADLHDKKNRDYTGDHSALWNFDFVADNLAIPNFMVAMQFILTKVARLSSLFSSKGTPKNESIADTFMDIAIYAILAKIMYEERLVAKE